MKNQYLNKIFIIVLFLTMFSQSHAIRSYNHQSTFGVWTEWTSFVEIPEKLVHIKKSQARIHLAIKKDELNDNNFNDLISLLQKLEREKIDYWLWPLLTKSEGYWPNQWNMDVYTQYVTELIQRLEKQNLHPKGISIDLEPPPEKLEKYLELVQKFKFKQLREYANSGIDENLFEKATLELTSFNRFLKSKNITTHIVTTPFILDDIPNHHLKKIFGIPNIDDNFDYISFMIYRSEFERIVGVMNSRIIYEYGLKAKAKFGDKAGLDLGVVGNIEFPHKLDGYSEPHRLWEDIAAAKASGINQMQIYCLDGIDSDEWIQDVPAKKPSYSVKNSLIQTMMKLLLKQLNSHN